MVTGRSHDMVTEEVSLVGILLFFVGLLPTVTVKSYKTQALQNYSDKSTPDHLSS